MTQMESGQERRRHPRFKVDDNILVFNQNTFGQIIDASEGGLAFRYLTSMEDGLDEECNIGLLNSSSGNHLGDIPCQLVRMQETDPIHPSGSTVIRTYALMFKDMSEVKQQEINDFFKDHIVQASPAPTEH